VKTYVGTDKGVGEGSNKWKWSGSLKMVMNPKHVFDLNLLTDTEKQKDIDYKKWQP